MMNGDGFIVDGDLNTGTFKRYRLTHERNALTMMPRFGFEMEGSYVIPALWTNSRGKNKGELKFGRLKL
ncbi:MAG: hypothetical protein EAY75_17300 [Bacteroidetes bacterium]|nr:MAG: hypothetical protein EAY75_17300 [Bacteroidota bacterium]